MINKIYNECCLETMRRMDDDSIDLVVTSPPYDNLRDYEGYHFPFEDIAKSLYRVMKNGGVIVWVVGDQTVNGSETGTSFRQALHFMQVGFKLHDTMIYAKPNAPLSHRRYEQEFEYMFIFTRGRPHTFNGIKDKVNKCADKIVGRSKRDVGTGRLRQLSGNKKGKKIAKFGLRTNIWHIPNRKKIAHPAPFPEQLVHDHIKSWSNENDIVYDPFMGSGTTAKMAMKLNRKYIGSEISSEYCQLAEKRIQNEKRQGRLGLAV